MSDRTMLSVRDLRYTYPDMDRPTIQGLDMTLSQGEIMAVQGTSGAGKSTLLYLLGLFIRPQNGRITLCGRDVATLDDLQRSRVRAHQIGFVFQDAALHMSLSVEQNVAEGGLYAGLSEADALRASRALLIRFEIDDLAQRVPTQLSGGQMQRVALCRALVRGPVLVLADEPTANLDAENALIVLAALRSAARDGASIVVATHNNQVVEACDRSLTLQ